MKDEEIRKYFIPIETKSSDPTKGKYSSKNKSFYQDIKRWQKDKIINKYPIRPIQFTFEITNRCNCNCKDCGMAANRIDTIRTSLTEKELLRLVDDLYIMGIPSFAITGGEPFLEFDKMCSMINYAKGKIDIVKIISNGFWGRNAEYYFKKMEENGLLENKFYVPTMQISIGEQTIPYEYICNIINYVATHYKKQEFNLGIIHTKERGLKKSKLSLLYKTYLKMYGPFPKDRVYLTESYYVNSNPLSTKKIKVAKLSAYDSLALCDYNFKHKIGEYVSPKLFMTCNGDCYPCEIFNHYTEIYLGNYFKDGLDKIMDNYNNNKYIKFIKDYGTIGFRDVIPEKMLKKAQCETSCYACEYCIKLCEKNKLIR